MSNFAYENDLIIQNNLPTRRWKTRRIHKGYDKKLRGIDKEYTRVNEEIRDLGYEVLDPPIQRGYRRLFVLTEDTKYTDRADFYQKILDKINTIRYSPHKTFGGKKRKIGKWKYRVKNEQELSEPDSYLFHNAKIFAEEEKEYFYRVDYFDNFGNKRTKYVFTEPWRFILRVKPNMITTVQVKDLELEQYRDELSYYLERNDNRRRLITIKGSSTFSWKKIIAEKEDRKRYQYNSFCNCPLHTVQEEYREEQLWLR